MDIYNDLFLVEKRIFYHIHWVLYQLLEIGDLSLYIIREWFIVIWRLGNVHPRKGGNVRYYNEALTAPWFYEQLSIELVHFHQKEFEESRRKLEKTDPNYDKDYHITISTKREPNGRGMICLNAHRFRPSIPGYIILPPYERYHCVDLRRGNTMGGLMYEKPIPNCVWLSLMRGVVEKKKKNAKRTSIWRKLEELSHIDGNFIISGFLGLG